MSYIEDITEEEMNSLTQGILTRYGIDFTCYEPKSLRRRIIRVINQFNLNSVHQLWLKFLQDPDFVKVFMNEVSVGMTSMFRDPILWSKLKMRMLKYPSDKQFSIWHAGCSTGEEVFSYGIVLEETRLVDRAKAFASDFNRNALEEAQHGVYDQIKMIENASNYMKYSPTKDFGRYYTSDGRHAVMKQNLIEHVSFDYHNLITDPYPMGFDIIFCRNVMIYFDTIAKKKILNRFYDSLNPDGLLIIGFFDTMNYLIDNDKFELVEEDAKIFRKK